MKIFLFLIYSIFFHAGLISFCFLFLRHNKPVLEQPKIEIQIRESALSGQGPSNEKKASGKRISNKSNFSNYLPGYEFKTGGLKADRESYLNNPLRDDPNSNWGSGGGTFERVADYNFFRQLYDSVEGQLFYPGVLARNRITGTVNARIVISNDGSCDWKRTGISGSNGYLSLYVLDVLKRVCLQNFKPQIGKREITVADLSFRFDINENNDWERVEREKIVVGNALLFYRNSHQSVAEWQLGPFKGIFPVPQVYLNIPWIQDNWNRLVKDKDPLIEFKKEAFESFSYFLSQKRQDTLSRIFRVEVNMTNETADDLIVHHHTDKELFNISQSTDSHDENQKYTLPQILINPETGQEVSFFDFPRNSLCPCGSLKKFKHCHGTPHEFARLMAS